MKKLLLIVFLEVTGGDMQSGGSWTRFRRSDVPDTETIPFNPAEGSATPDLDGLPGGLNYLRISSDSQTGTQGLLLK